MRVKLSPNVRLRATLQYEMAIDKEGKVFTDELLAKHVFMHRQAIERITSLSKSLILSNAILALLITGKDMSLPFSNLSTSDIPAAVESFAIFSSLTFMFLCLTFANEQFYRAIVEAMSTREAKKMGIDGDFVSSGDIYTEFYVKTFRETMNFDTFDYFTPGKAYKLYYGLLGLMVAISLVLLLLLHLILIGYAIWLTAAATWVAVLYVATVILMNLSGLLTTLGISLPFAVRGFENDDDQQQGASR